VSHEASVLSQDIKKVEKAAFSMAGGTLTSRILGLFRDMAMAALFDRATTDAWTAAFRLPNLFRRLFGEGSLSVSFIPVFLQAQGEDPTGDRAKNLLNALYTLFLLLVGGLTVLGILYMEPLLKIFLSADYVTQSTKWILTVRMARIMFGFVYFISFYAYFMGILNALGSFGLPALAPALLNASMLIFTFMPKTWFSQSGDGLAWGVLVGGAGQAAFLWAVLQRRGYLPRIKLRPIWNQDVRHVVMNMAPGVFGLGLLQFLTLVNLYFSSSLNEGAISYIYWADRLLELPLTLVSVSLGTAILPTLTELALFRDENKFKSTIEEYFILNLFISIPAAMGLYILAEPIIEILFKRGHFSVSDVEQTAMVLKVYALSLPFIASVRVLSPAFYALKNTWIPALISLVSLLCHIAFASRWIHYLGLRGLVISSLTVMALQFFLLSMALIFFKKGFALKKLFIEMNKLLFSALIFGAGLQLYQVFLELLLNQSWLGPVSVKILALVLGAFLALILYVYSAHIFGMKFATSIIVYLKKGTFLKKASL
jgi:putative peptidoglycan lipid II flippase